MSTTRTFTVSSSSARLIARERGGESCSEGYFSEGLTRSVFVRMEPSRASLILTSATPAAPNEENATIPQALAQALLQAATGQVEYTATPLSFGSHTGSLRRYWQPRALDLIIVTFAGDEEARAFQAPSWLSFEVSDDPAYRAQSLALQGMPAVAEVDLTNQALNDLLDYLLDPLDQEQDQILFAPTAPGERLSSQPKTLEVADAAEDGFEDQTIRDLAQALRPHRR